MSKDVLHEVNENRRVIAGLISELQGSDDRVPMAALTDIVGAFTSRHINIGTLLLLIEPGEGGDLSSLDRVRVLSLIGLLHVSNSILLENYSASN
tara:strand:- start:79 stop:363 length:285 start_codon:yes stop_codon:yes gene_type:complete